MKNKNRTGRQKYIPSDRKCKTAYITAVKEKENKFVLRIPVSILSIIAEKGNFNGSKD